MDWRLLIHPNLPGSRQMAIDEALYETVEPGKAPVLRFYTWQSPTLSLGYFQDYKRVVQESFVVHNKIDVVRRITGGRAVLHQYEVTYSLAGSLENEFANQSLRETYRLIANALNLGLKNIGLDRPYVQSDASLDRTEHRLPQCFVSVSQFEHSTGMKKIIGSAQKRSRDRFLQHGSILLDFDAHLQNGCIRNPDPDIERKVAPLNRILGRSFGFEEVVGCFHAAFEETFQKHTEPSELTAQELEMAATLEVVGRSEDWVRSGCR
jgi:lipoate-protein ligase A